MRIAVDADFGTGHIDFDEDILCIECVVSVDEFLGQALETGEDEESGLTFTIYLKDEAATAGESCGFYVAGLREFNCCHIIKVKNYDSKLRDCSGRVYLSFDFQQGGLRAPTSLSNSGHRILLMM